MERILMLVAHPDDEALFGFHDLFYNDVTVICFTNGTNTRRRTEFELSARTFGFKGHMLNYRDSEHDNWSRLSNDTVLRRDLYPIVVANEFDRVVSHGADGEYGHIQHKRVHSIAQATATFLKLPFADFASRWHLGYSKELIEAKKRIPDIYASQKGIVLRYMNYFEPK
jgi:LmbE family N-acetylglucosaminyl deacetylase